MDKHVGELLLALGFHDCSFQPLLEGCCVYIKEYSIAYSALWIEFNRLLGLKYRIIIQSVSPVRTDIPEIPSNAEIQYLSRLPLPKDINDCCSLQAKCAIIEKELGGINIHVRQT